MNPKVFLFVGLLLMLNTCEVESQDFLKDAFSSVKDVFVKGYHHVAHIFVNHDHSEDENKKESEDFQEESTIPLEKLIDVRYKKNEEESITEELLPPSFRQREESEEKDNVPDLGTRFLISAPCADGMRKSAGGCRQVISN